MAFGGWSQFDDLLGGSRFDWNQFDDLLGSGKPKLPSELRVSTDVDEALSRVGAPAPARLQGYVSPRPQIPEPPEAGVGLPIPGARELGVAGEMLTRAGKAATTAIPETVELLQKNREKQLWSLATGQLGRRLSEPEFQALLQADRKRDPFYREPPEGFWTNENLADIIGTAVGFGPLGLASMAGAETGLAARMALGAGENLLFSAPHVAATAQEHGPAEALTEAGIAGGLGALFPAVTGVGRLRRAAARVDAPENPIYTPPRVAEPVDHVADFQAMDQAAVARAEAAGARRLSAEEALRYRNRVEEGFRQEQARKEAAAAQQRVLGPGEVAEVGRPPEVAPAAQPGRTVTAYQGEGAAGGAGADPRWWSTDPKRAASFGRVKSVEIPEEVLASAQAEARRLGSGTGTDLVLPDELTRGARETNIEPDVYDLTETPEPGASQPVVGTRPITGEARFESSAPDQPVFPRRERPAPDMGKLRSEAKEKASEFRSVVSRMEQAKRSGEELTSQIRQETEKGFVRPKGGRVDRWREGIGERVDSARARVMELLENRQPLPEGKFSPEVRRAAERHYRDLQETRSLEGARRIAEAESRQADLDVSRATLERLPVEQGQVMMSVRGKGAAIQIEGANRAAGTVTFKYGTLGSDGVFYPSSKSLTEPATLLRNYRKTSADMEGKISEALRKRSEAVWARAGEDQDLQRVVQNAARKGRELGYSDVGQVRHMEEALEKRLEETKVARAEAAKRLEAQRAEQAAVRAQREGVELIEVTGKTEPEMFRNMAESAQAKVKQYAVLDESGEPMTGPSGRVYWKENIPEWTRFKLGDTIMEVQTRQLDEFASRARRPIQAETAGRIVGKDLRGPEKLVAEDVVRGERLPSGAFKKGEFEKVKAQGKFGETPEGYFELYGGLPLPAMWKAAKAAGRPLSWIYERALQPFEKAIAKYGEPGKELARRARVYRESFERRAGSAIARADRLIGKLSDLEWGDVIHALNTGAKPPPGLKDTVRELSEIFGEVYDRARSLGWEIGYIRDYFPRMWEKMPDEIREQMAKVGALDPRTGRQLMIPARSMSANLELSRQAQNVSGWRTDKKVVQDYLLDAYQQLAQIEAFGALNAQGKFRPGNQLVKAYSLAAEMGRFGKNAEDLGAEFVERVTGQHVPDTGATALRGVRKATAFVSLTMSSLAQAAQVHTIPGFTGAGNFLQAMKDVAADPKRFYNRALEAGATIPALRSELAEAVGGGGIKNFMWGAPTVDKLGRVIAERSGELFASGLEKAGNVKALTELLEASGRKYGGALSDADLLAVGKYIADTTQLRATAERLPAFWSTEIGKTMFQFGHFMYGMTRLHVELGSAAIRAASAGDWSVAWTRAVKPMVGMVVAGVVAGELLNDARLLLSGIDIDLPSKDDLLGRPEESTGKLFDQITTRMQETKRSKNLFIRALQNLSYAGTLGLPQYLGGRLEDVLVEKRLEQVAPALSKTKAVLSGIEQGAKGHARAFGGLVAKGPLGATVGGLRRAFTITKVKPFGIPFPGFEVGKFKSGARKAYRNRIAQRRIQEIEEARGRR